LEKANAERKLRKWQKFRTTRKTLKSACRVIVQLVPVTAKAPEKDCIVPEDQAVRKLKREAVTARNVLSG
jgi:hypothetical protein